MDGTFYLKILASDRIFYEGRCRFLVVHVSDGEKGIMAHHENMLIAIDIGALRLQTEAGEWIYGLTGNGFAQIINNRVTVLVDFAERPDEIDARRAREAKERAEEQMRQKQSIQEYHHSQAAMARALARLRMKGEFHEIS